jgi:hypothetical protein
MNAWRTDIPEQGTSGFIWVEMLMQQLHAVWTGKAWLADDGHVYRGVYWRPE